MTNDFPAIMGVTFVIGIMYILVNLVVDLLMQQWWISTFPGLAILSVAIATNFIGDALRDAIDPRLRVR